MTPNWPAFMGENTISPGPAELDQIRTAMRFWAKRWRTTKGKARRIALKNACAERREYQRLAGQQPNSTTP
jgi:hypothetical protein